MSFLSSFISQLYHYGFEKLDCGVDRGAYYHPQFRKDDLAMCSFIERRRKVERTLLQQRSLGNSSLRESLAEMKASPALRYQATVGRSTTREQDKPEVELTTAPPIASFSRGDTSQCFPRLPPSIEQTTLDVVPTQPQASACFVFGVKKGGADEVSSQIAAYNREDAVTKVHHEMPPTYDVFDALKYHGSSTIPNSFEESTPESQRSTRKEGSRKSPPIDWLKVLEPRTIEEMMREPIG